MYFVVSSVAWAEIRCTKAGRLNEDQARSLGGAVQMIYEWRFQAYLISTDRQRVDLSVVHQFLSEESYWAKGRPYEVTCKALDHSLCFGLYDPNGAQAGFARAITDYATFAYIADLFVLTPHRGRGLGKWLVKTIIDHPDLHLVAKFRLRTRDAHGLYTQFGFTRLTRAEEHMVLSRLAVDPADEYAYADSQP